MSGEQYTTMSQIPSQGYASQAKAGNGREGFGRGGPMGGRGGPMGGRGGRMASQGAPMAQSNQFMEAGCAFPQPPPARVYCQPAAFTSLDGRKYLRLLDAYGQSAPAMSYY